MNVAAGPELAAAVTNAGGLGVIGGVGYTPEFLKKQIGVSIFSFFLSFFFFFFFFWFLGFFFSCEERRLSRSIFFFYIVLNFFFLFFPGPQKVHEGPQRSFRY